MKIHEYQAKEILRGYGVAVPRGKLVQSQDEAVAAARELMGEKGVVVVKAQIHAGGRGKGGGVKLARSPEEAGEVFKKMMGMQLVTHQTGPQGQKVRKIYVEEGCDIERPQHVHGLVGRRHGDRGSRREAPGEDPARGDRSGHRPRWIPGARSGVRARPLRQRGEQLRPLRHRNVQGVRGERCQHRGDQSAGGHEARRRDCARRQDQPRRQRALPPQGAGRAPRSRRRGSA